MIKRTFNLLLIVGLLSCKQDNVLTNSFNPGKLWLDTNGEHINAHGGGFLIYNNTYYWFGEHKITGKEGNRAMVGVGVYSSKDLYNWKNEGIALEVSNDSNSKLIKGCTLERPKVIYNKKTKKFVMWFHHELKGQGYDAALTGVAISDNITGPYNYIDSFRIHPGVLPLNFSQDDFDNASIIESRKDENWKEKVIKGGFLKRDFKGGQMSRDMTLFVDDDQTAYHITASEQNQTLLISKLSDDYQSLSNEYVRVFPGQRNEAPAIFKKEGTYFMVSSGLTGWKPNPGKLAVANNIMGDWEFLGNPCRGTDEENKTTFWSQSTYVIPVLGKKDAFIFAADRWRPENPIDGRYVWLPIKFENNIPYLEWENSWDLTIFND
ncbi:MAG: glycoside hydrolase family 43 protein [Algibacter sp.]|uniref:glycoside hydrolase family 43 protein n=1 Tax=Algibacter sp. TaxID=1872428 RepID=UPI0026126FAC|nr:glycoside hydrolase family 43 protein [Algibacter sp.]MDG1729160.1 glycoside hydrolase family 43 protein [Algibacter sp.]MDG2178417.1 glycoside hydrolase family 43 protein [Algibacter sp.]